MAINLGATVKCKITGFSGVVVAETRWLHGCLRYLVQPSKLEAGKMLEPQSFDEPQLLLLKDVAAPRKVKTGGPAPSPTRAPGPVR